MEGVVALAICVLATIFVGSFVSLVLLCRHNSLRKKTAKYVTKLSPSGTWWRERRGVGGRCLDLLGLCRSLDLRGGPALTPDHIDTLRRILQVARSIAEEAGAGEKAAPPLLHPHTASLLLQASTTLAALQHKLLALKEDSSVEDVAPPIIYQSAIFI